MGLTYLPSSNTTAACAGGSPCPMVCACSCPATAGRRRFRITKLPRFLVLHVRRFLKNQVGGAGWVDAGEGEGGPEMAGGMQVPLSDPACTRMMCPKGAQVPTHAPLCTPKQAAPCLPALQFFIEKNPTIVNFPVKNLELAACVPVPQGALGRVL